MGSYVELLKACKEGNAKKVKKLLVTCKNIADVRDLTDKTLLHYCFQNESCTDLILEIAPELLNVGEKSGYTVVHLASMMKPPTPLPYLLSKNPDINVKTNELRTPLLLAVIYDNYEAAKILCEANAEVNVTDCLGVSPLHYAAKAKSDKDVDQPNKIIDLLLDFKSKIDFHDSFERTPLIWAVSSNNLIKMRHLISKGANINAKDVSGLSILHYATSNGNLDMIESILSEYDFSIETVDNNHCTALMYACTMNQRIVVQSLIDHGANVNAEDLKRRNAVHFACGKGDADIVRILAENNADLWKFNEDLTFPLHEVSFKGHEEIVRFFMTNYSPADRLSDLINRKNANGQTSLHLAAVKDHLEICRILLENGADPNIQLRASNGKSMTALDLANRTSTKELIIEYNGKTTDELTNMCPITEENTYSISDESETEFSLESNSFDNVDETVKKKESDSDFSEKNEDNWGGFSNENEENRNKLKEKDEETGANLTGKKEKSGEIEVTEMLRKFLLELCYKGETDEIRSFASRGVCMSDIVDNNGKNLLHYSVKNIETFALILELAPDCVNRCDNSRISVLNLSVMSKDNDSLELLLAHGADYNFVDDSGRTCLHLAVIYNNLAALKLIGSRVTENVGDSDKLVHRADNDGNYPLHYAVELYRIHSADNSNHSRDFIEALLAMTGDLECRDKTTRTPLLLAVNISNIEATVALIDHGADILARDNHCLCSIHYACSEGNWEMFSLLAAHRDFDPDIADQNGLTPIFYAVASCNDKIVQLLIQLKARVDITDRYGRNLCHKASEKGAFKCLELLLLQQVDPWLPSNDGTMPLHEAAYRGYKEIAEILLNTGAANDNVNVKNISGQTALHLAAVRNDCPMCFLLINKGSSVNELLYDGASDCDVTAYDLATTQYCKDTLYTFGGRSAKRILDNVSVEELYTDDDQIHRLDELLKDNSIFEPQYSVRSTELALSTLPSLMNQTSRTFDRTSQIKLQSTKVSSLRSDSHRPQKQSSTTSSKSPLISPKAGNSQCRSPSKDTDLLVRLPDDDKYSPQSSSDKPDTLQLSPVTRKSGSNAISSKSSKRSKTSHSGSNCRRHTLLSSSSPSASTVISQRIQDKVQLSIFNYEFIRLDSRIACELARQKIRKENVEKLINPKTPKMLRRAKAIS